ncbi:MAG: nickel/cobalt transporter [Hyphomicrobiales bacterium]|nr:nickel/cobalt transporter [Hyphomicrobiales bacterium]
MKAATSSRLIAARAPLAFVVCASLVWCASPALAQHHPFAVGANEGSVGAGNGLVAWLIAEQARFYRMLTGAVREARTSAAGFWLLAGLSFAYGVFHAAGPGHGKAVMASYMIANERALRRGLVLTFLAALLQGAVAVSIVGVAAILFNATAQRMTAAAEAIEMVSYGAVATLGLWLVWTKGRAFLREARALAPSPAPALAAAGATPSRFACDAIEPGHVHTADCGHFHAPDPATLDKDFSWGSALATIVAAGARPCSGAILVLVFALSQGVLLAGIGAVAAMSLGTAITTGALAAVAVLAKGLALRLTAATGRGALVARGAELLAAIIVLGAGLALLAGAWASAGVA